jgi:large subunit ribosomal protein L25
METIEIKCSFRKELGKKATKELRKNNNVPCVMYGGGKENINFYAPSLSFKKLVYTPNAYLVNINIDGKQFKAIMKDIQFHPVSDKINHIDFVEISDDKPVEMNIPVRITGNSEGVKKGGRLILNKRYLKVKALPKDLPVDIKINVDDLDIGQSIKVMDLQYKNIILLNQSREPVVSVRTSRLATKEEETPTEAQVAEAAAAEAPAETEENK